jgi:hypothetical protein
MDELPSYRDIPYRSRYIFGCPVGEWRARLDAKAWGRQQNLIMYFSQSGTGHKYCISVFKPSCYKPEDGRFAFRVHGQPGEFFELETARTRTGRTELLSARILAEEARADFPDAETARTLTLVS